MNKKVIINSVLALSCLFAAALIKAHCCEVPIGHCENWWVVYTNDPTQAIETDGGQVLEIQKGENDELLCPSCQHPISDHGCDASGFGVGPRFKEKV